MAIADRKLRFWKERDRLILEATDQLLSTEGYLGLNLNSVADHIEYSKATIYNHYETKEDLLLAVVNMHMERRLDYFGRALTLPGFAREQFFAVGFGDLLLSRLSPHIFTLLQLSLSPSIWEKSTKERHQAFNALQERVVTVMRTIFSKAVEEKNLSANDVDFAQVLLGVVGMSKGCYLLESSPDFLAGLSPAESAHLLFRNYHAYLDGLNWEPYFRDHDYGRTLTRIEQELFPDEVREIGGLFPQHTEDSTHILVN